jgi:hypothetical protein
MIIAGSAKRKRRRDSDKENETRYDGLCLYYAPSRQYRARAVAHSLGVNDSGAGADERSARDVVSALDPHESGVTGTFL